MAKNNQAKVVAIVGPTASGKTTLSLELAKLFNGEIISADSRQVYQGLNIGTEKITPAEMAGVPHHLIDVCLPERQYTALDFKTDAEALVQSITERGRLPIIVGGTFFYIDAWLGRVSLPEVAPNQDLRKRLEEKSTAELQAELVKIDSERAATIDTANRRRLIRAIEIGQALGRVPPSPPLKPTHQVLSFGLKTDRDDLLRKIHERAKEALKKGLVEETKSLLVGGLSKERLNEIGLEYRLVIEHLDGLYDEKTLLRKISEKNWQYAKRQLTWLKKDPEIKWFNPGEVANIIDVVKGFINEK